MTQRISASIGGNHLPSIVRLQQLSADWRGTMILSPCPTINHEERDNINIIDQWSDTNVRMVITLLEQREIETLRFDSLAEHLSQTDILWHHLPVRNMQAPPASCELILQKIITEMAQCFTTDNSVFIHCHAGLGRTGLIAATVLKTFGMPTDAAINAIRAHRPGSIESQAQEIFVGSWNFKLPNFPPRL